jgi:hypothetical protein
MTETDPYSDWLASPDPTLRRAARGARARLRGSTFVAAPTAPAPIAADLVVERQRCPARYRKAGCGCGGDGCAVSVRPVTAADCLACIRTRLFALPAPAGTRPP